ncbi:DNA topoisomerase IB [Aquibaculum sediminis]|uniref:DNA topoisomerase IB n=1 Tax=Aquibaculum sediminis TaxID=3231907 RepID=UPI0034555A10
MSSPQRRRALRATGLRLAKVEGLTIRRQRCGRGFTYQDEAGQRIDDAETLQRIRSLAIPPAYKEVCISPDPRGHLQAVGRDAAGRLQYRYHPGWEEVREAEKVERLSQFCASLPRLRRRVRRDLRKEGLTRERVLAGIVLIIDRTHIRIGCEDYVHSGRTRGAATLLKRNVHCDGKQLSLTFRGKGGREIRCELAHPSLTALARELHALPGRRFFQYRDAHGKRHKVTAGEVNAYLREAAGAPVTAKDFRSLTATAAAGQRLARLQPEPRERARNRQIATVMHEVAEMLSNTPAVVRRSYVHRCVVQAFTGGTLAGRFAKCRPADSLSRAETLVAQLVWKR